MDKATMLQSLSDLSAAITPIPNSGPSVANLASVTSFVSAWSTNQPIAPPAPPVITTPMQTTTSSSQIRFISATNPGPMSNIWVSNALDALVFSAPRDLAMLIEDIQVDSCREFVTASGTGSTTFPNGVNNVTIQRLNGPSVHKRGLYIRHDSANWLVEDVSFISHSVNIETGVIPMGVQLKETAHDLVFRRGLCEGFQSDWTLRDPGGYWNADGFVAERGNYNILVEDWICRNCTDGGFDFKATNMRLHRVLAEGCARNYRFWTNNNHGQVESRNPIKRGGSGGCRHVGIYGATTDLHFERFVAVDDKPNPIFVDDRTDKSAPLNIIIDSHQFNVPEGTPVAVGDKINLVLK